MANKNTVIKAAGGKNVNDLYKSQAAIKTTAEALVALGGTITGATANDTMTAIADATAASTDTSAASLTSVNTAIAAIENNFADLQTKVNAIVAALKL